MYFLNKSLKTTLQGKKSDFGGAGIPPHFCIIRKKNWQAKQLTD
jgi:hypothetical protein